MLSTLHNIVNGNRCGHNPLRPVLELQSPIRVGKGGLPRILSLAKECVIKYFDKPNVLPTLNGSNLSLRQQRSEQREACIQVMEALLKYCDIATLRVGIPNGEKFRNITIDFLVKQTNLTKRRVERAIHNIKKAGILISVQPRRTKDNGEIRGLPALRFLSEHFFAALGLRGILQAERKKALKRRKKAIAARKQEEERSITSRKIGNLNLLARSMGNVLRRSKKVSVPSLHSKYTAEEREAKRQEMLMQGQVMRDNPDWIKGTVWPREKILAEVARRLRR